MHNHILGAQNFVVVDVVEISILCAEFFHACRLIYCLSMAETRGHQYQRGAVGIYCCGGLSHNHILGAKNFVVVEVVEISILCADFFHACRFIYCLAMAETRDRQKQRGLIIDSFYPQCSKTICCENRCAEGKGNRWMHSNKGQECGGTSLRFLAALFGGKMTFLQLILL